MSEEALDFCLRELSDPSGLCRAGQRAAEGKNPYLFTPAQLRQILGEEKGRGFAECYDVTDEGTRVLAREVAKRIEKEMQYPGQIRVNVIRETRSTQYAK